MTPALTEQVAKVQTEISRLGEMIIDEIAAVAARRGITKMVFAFWTTLYKDGKEVEDGEIKALEDLYLQHVNKCGFESIWTKKDGWNFGNQTPA